MKRLIYASETIESYNGFYFTAGRDGYFLKSEMTNLTDKIIRRFINAVCDRKGVGDKIRESALYDPATLKDFRRRIDKATLEHKVSDKADWYTLSGRGFTVNSPKEEFEKEMQEQEKEL